jgi:hypothetical protein
MMEPMRTTKLFAAAAILIATALVGGTLIGSVLAAQRENAGDDTAAGRALPGIGPYCDVFLDTFAAELGTSRDAVASATRAALGAAIDAAVADGAMNEQRATALKERLVDSDAEPCAMFGRGIGPMGRGGPHGHGGPGAGAGGRGLGGLISPAAEVLGMTPGELRREMRGSSLQEVAGAGYGAASAAILDAVQARINAALADGLPQERADAALERVQAWLEAGGPAESAPGPGLGRGGHGGGGPPPWAGQDEDDED